MSEWNQGLSRRLAETKIEDRTSTDPILVKVRQRAVAPSHKIVGVDARRRGDVVQYRALSPLDSVGGVGDPRQYLQGVGWQGCADGDPALH
jgi:hypothetical protein